MRAAQPAWRLHSSLSICSMDPRHNSKTQNPGAEMDKGPTIKAGLAHLPASSLRALLSPFAWLAQPFSAPPKAPLNQ